MLSRWLVTENFFLPQEMIELPDSGGFADERGGRRQVRGERRAARTPPSGVCTAVAEIFGPALRATLYVTLMHY